jgi:hypothetical protein
VTSVVVVAFVVVVVAFVVVVVAFVVVVVGARVVEDTWISLVGTTVVVASVVETAELSPALEAVILPSADP